MSTCTFVQTKWRNWGNTVVFESIVHFISIAMDYDYRRAAFFLKYLCSLCTKEKFTSYIKLLIVCISYSFWEKIIATVHEIFNKTFLNYNTPETCKVTFCSAFIDSLIHNILNCVAQNFDGES